MTGPSTHPAAAPMVTRRDRVLIVDGRNMIRLWLEEKVARRELSAAEADRMLHEQEDQGKLWGGPFKDALGNGRTIAKLARDFASWKGARVEFGTSRAGHDLVIFKGWPNGRKLVSGTRYRVDNPKMIELQIGKPGLRAAAKESARFGVYLVVAVDVADYLLSDHATLGSLLGHLSVDVPSVVLASIAGAAAGSAVAGSSAAGLAVIGSLAFGPLAVAFFVGVGVAVLLYEADEHFGIARKLGQAYDQALAKLARVWQDLGDEAQARYRQLANSHLVHDLQQDTRWLVTRIGRQADLVRGELISWW